MRAKNFLPVGTLLLPVLAIACGGADSDSGEAEEAAPAETMEAATLTPATDAAEADGLVNPNDASAEALGAVAGMTEDAVAALTAARPFANMVDVHAVLSGTIGEEAALAAYESLWLPLSLNDASTEEILLIPPVRGHGPVPPRDREVRGRRGSRPVGAVRQAHEFEEYRPYVDMDQFRREIGKYVDEEEVARHPGQPRIRDLALPARVPDHRHGSREQDVRLD